MVGERAQEQRQGTWREERVWGGVCERERLRTAAGHQMSDSTTMGRKQALEIHGSERPIVDSLRASIPLCRARMWCSHACVRDACVCVLCVFACVYVHECMCACCACGAPSLSRCLDLLLRPCISAPVRVPVAVLVFFASAFMCLKRELPQIFSLPCPFYS